MVAILALLAVGCAHRAAPGELGPLHPVVDPYSRNLIVCIPTALGTRSAGFGGRPFAYLAPEDPCSFN